MKAIKYLLIGALIVVFSARGGTGCEERHRENY